MSGGGGRFDIGPLAVTYSGREAAALALLLAELSGVEVARDHVPHIAAMRLLADAMRGRSQALLDGGAGRVLVHEAQTIRMIRPMKPDTAMIATGTAVLDGDRAAVLALDARDDAQALVVELETRLRLAEPEALAATRETARIDAVLSQSGTLSAPLTAAHVARYADMSGDHNPLHLDADLAGRAGLPGCVVHGMLLVGVAEAVLVGRRAGWRVAETRTRFLAPVFTGERVSTVVADRGSTADGAWRARASVFSQDGVLACVTDAVLRPA